MHRNLRLLQQPHSKILRLRLAESASTHFGNTCHGWISSVGLSSGIAWPGFAQQSGKMHCHLAIAEREAASSATSNASE